MPSQAVSTASGVTVHGRGARVVPAVRRDDTTYETCATLYMCDRGNALLACASLWGVAGIRHADAPASTHSIR